MLAGRKTRTLPLKEKTEASRTINTSAPARNLRKGDLGAVIFGCKHHTFQECLLKQMFGLPAAHYSYVKNVIPGLALFLFNYSDRTLHGIFEAATPGQMNINPYAWITNEGTSSTPYAAQVRVHVRRQCKPLHEAEFKPIISSNYYAKRLFWFELDKEQTGRLIQLFLSSPLPEKIPHPSNAARWNSMFDVLSTDGHKAANDARDPGLRDKSGVPDMKLKENNDHSYASAIVYKNTTVSEKKWTELFTSSSSSCALRNGEGLEAQKAKSNASISNCYNTDWECSQSSRETSEQSPQACSDAANGEFDSYVVEIWEKHASSDNEVDEICENQETGVKDNERDTTSPDIAGVPSSCEASEPSPQACSDETNGEFDSYVGESWEEYASSDNEVDEISENQETGVQDNERNTASPDFASVPSSDDRISESVVLASKQFPVSDSIVLKLMEEIEELKTSELKRRQKVDLLEHELVECKLEIGEFKKRCHNLENMASSATDHCEVECRSPNSATDESVLIVGGFDGCSWLPDLCSYYPSKELVVSLCPMTFSRSYATVARSNGELYLLGGTHDGVWYDTVESYNPMSDKWVQRPSLNQKKGSLAGASVYDRIFALGGGNGVECFAEVELFDINIGRWISTQSMHERRFALAATDMYGAIYVSGGYDGTNYLRSVERFDPREQTWTSIGSMNTKRGCHSLVAFRGKLYAIGGYDGTTMVSAVEVFDPRVGLWMMGEPMTFSRGYSGSFVLGGRIYVIGGIQEKEVLDVVECYNEDSGWQVTGSSAFGKRCFFSTFVL